MTLSEQWCSHSPRELSVCHRKPYYHITIFPGSLFPPTNHYLLPRLISIANKTQSKNSDGSSRRGNRTELTNYVRSVERTEGTECSNKEVNDDEGEVSSAYYKSDLNWTFLYDFRFYWCHTLLFRRLHTISVQCSLSDKPVFTEFSILLCQMLSRINNNSPRHCWRT